MKQQGQAPTNLLENLRKVITLVDQLRDIGLQDYIKLPRIVVLGIQSSGKSSLLEQIVGIDFLPRGDGVVTRRPLELRLTYIPKITCPEPYAVFEEIKGQKFTDFSKVKDNIIMLTDKIAGTSKNIVDKPIILQVFGPNCPDLTLVDLPGITRIPMEGQDKNIEEVTKNMARKYCEDPSTIILCVIAANQDLSTSDALSMARQLDPKGDRTFGVLTKIDIMDKGTNALKMLKNQEISLQYGYVGVKLRSQQDIKDNLTVQKAIQQEKEFFAGHPVYSSIPGDYFGTAVLTTKLTNILYKHIRSFLPDLMKEINKKVALIDERLIKLGPGLPVEDKDKLHYIWQIINEFTIRFKNSISGSYEKSALSSQTRPPAGSRIREQFTELLHEQEQGSYKVLKSVADQDIQQIIYKYEGDNIPGFLSVDAFYALLDPELKKIIGPSSECVDETYQVLEEYAVSILNDQLEKLPAVKQLISEQVLHVLQRSKDLTIEAVNDLLESEIGYVFTNDFGFLTNQQLQMPGQENQKQEKENQNHPLVFELRKKIEHYYKLVIRTVRDNVPKLIGHFLVRGCQNSMLLSLQENLMQNSEYLNIINEPESIAEERKQLKKEVETLKAAQKIVKRDPDLSDYILRLQSPEVEDVKDQKKANKVIDEEEKSQSTVNQVNLQKKQEVSANGSQQNQNSQAQQNQQQNVNQKNQQQSLSRTSTQSEQEEKVTGPAIQTQPNQQQQQQQQQSQNQQQQKQQQQPQAQPQQQQGGADPLNNKQPVKKNMFKDQYEGAVDKGVDKAMEDPRVQEGLKSGARQGAAKAVDEKLPGAPSWVKKGAENMAETAISSQAAQNAIKDQAKTALKDPISSEEKPATSKGLFGFMKKP